MNIENLVATPKLVEIILDDVDLLERYGEPITFYAYDIVCMSVYFVFFNARSTNEFEALGKLIRKMILNDQGKQVLSETQDLPIDIMAAAVTKIGDILGKSLGKKSTPNSGEAQA